MAGNNYTIREFHSSVDAWIKAAGDGLLDVVKIACSDIHRDLVMASPVDTGRFRGNWQITFNKPPLYALNNYDQDGAKTIQEGQRVLGLIGGKGVAVTKVYFSNMLIYANALEYGHSKQAPAGVLGIVAVRLRSYFANAVKESRSKHAI